ncbi:GPW/gp25 family protein [Burkholderia cenocepacia]|uniref:GPW/gp25 family protein n=1 Tax=Burkholderia cenocepacia TaxID=95486 RepID=UPI0004840741|nr:GPW/gp25 family protein [Burkholderia cenocepacia]
MSGMDAKTGAFIDGDEHLSQSVEIIMSTPLASRIKRRTFGSELPDLIDGPANRALLVRVYAAVATAIMRWEPRLTLTKVAFDAAVLAAGDFRNGRVPILIEGYKTVNGRQIPVSVKSSVDVAGVRA